MVHENYLFQKEKKRKRKKKKNEEEGFKKEQ